MKELSRKEKGDGRATETAKNRPGAEVALKARGKPPGVKAEAGSNGKRKDSTRRGAIVGKDIQS